MAFVLDCSVARAWVLPDEGSAFADGLLDRLVAEGAVVPPVWPIELGNVLLAALRQRRIRRTHGTGAPDAADACSSLNALRTGAIIPSRVFQYR